MSPSTSHFAFQRALVLFQGYPIKSPAQDCFSLVFSPVFIRITSLIRPCRELRRCWRSSEPGTMSRYRINTGCYIKLNGMKVWRKSRGENYYGAVWVCSGELWWLKENGAHSRKKCTILFVKNYIVIKCNIIINA